jgi:putative ABC transport system permease protein
MRDIITEIWQTARRNKLRTTLTGFAVAWGIFMIIVLLGAGNGLINANLKQSGNWLSNSMEAYGGRTSKAYQGLSEGRYIEMNTRDLETTESEFKNTIDAVGAVYYHSATVTNGEQYMNMQIIGIHPIHSSIVKRDLVCGRFINEIDLK